MKNTALFISLILLALFLMPAYGQVVKYVGTVKYSEELICSASGGGNDGGYRWNSSCNKTRTKKGTINVYEPLLVTKGLGNVKLHKEEFNLFFNPSTKCICYGKKGSEKWFNVLKKVEIMDNERYAMIEGKKHSLIWDNERSHSNE